MTTFTSDMLTSTAALASPRRRAWSIEICRCARCRSKAAALRTSCPKRVFWILFRDIGRPASIMDLLQHAGTACRWLKAHFHGHSAVTAEGRAVRYIILRIAW